MCRKILFLMLCLGMFFTTKGQSIFTQTFSTSGGGDLINSYTLGETFVFSDNITLTEGFHQINWQILPLAQKGNSHNIKIFPNPTTQVIQVQTEYNSIFEMEIKDLLGKQLINKTTQENLSTFDIFNFPSATYLISIRDLTNGEQWVYKFIKKDN